MKLRMFWIGMAAAMAATTLAADKEVEDLLARMRKAYAAVRSVSLAAKARVQYPQGELSHAIAMDYARPNKLRLTFDFRGQSIKRISDGRKVYTFVEGSGDEERSNVDVSPVSMDALGGDAPINLESMGFFDWKRQLSTEKGANMAKSEFKLIASEKWNGREWTVLEETAHGQNVFARYFIDPKTWFIWRCDVKSLDKRAFFMDVQLVKLALNPKFAEGTFKAPASALKEKERKPGAPTAPPPPRAA